MSRCQPPDPCAFGSDVEHVLPSSGSGSLASPRAHLPLRVRDLSGSAACYRACFGADPVTEGPANAPFPPSWCPLSLDTIRVTDPAGIAWGVSLLDALDWQVEGSRAASAACCAR